MPHQWPRRPIGRPVRNPLRPRGIAPAPHIYTPPPPRNPLTDLEPRWIHEDVFVFLCPHCRAMLLSCKRVVMSRWEQCQIFATQLGEWSDRVVPCKPDCAWKFERGESFATMSVSPSLDASAAGHWHGTIAGGKVCGGSQVSKSGS